jgi:hypothetical protein
MRVKEKRPAQIEQNDLPIFNPVQSCSLLVVSYDFSAKLNRGGFPHNAGAVSFTM